MVGTLIRHMIYDKCIDIAFNRAGRNFATVMPVDRLSRLMMKWDVANWRWQNRPATMEEFWQSYKQSLNNVVGYSHKPEKTVGIIYMLSYVSGISKVES
jgi:hypothetical protein